MFRPHRRRQYGTQELAISLASSIILVMFILYLILKRSRMVTRRINEEETNYDKH